jgi:type IV secretory pathway component VirB8
MAIALLQVKLASFALFLHCCLASQLSLLLVLLSVIIIVVFIELEQHNIFVVWCCSPTRAMVSSFTRFLDHT